MASFTVDLPATGPTPSKRLVSSVFLPTAQPLTALPPPVFRHRLASIQSADRPLSLLSNKAIMHGVVLRRPHCWVGLKNIPHGATIWSGWIFSASLTHKLPNGVLARRYFGLLSRQLYKYLFWKRLMALIHFQDCAANERESDNKTKHAGMSLV